MHAWSSSARCLDLEEDDCVCMCVWVHACVCVCMCVHVSVSVLCGCVDMRVVRLAPLQCSSAGRPVVGRR